MDLKKNKPELGINLGRTLFPSLISHDKKYRRKGFFALKSALDFPDLCVAADFIDKNIVRNKEMLFGNPLPKQYDLLGESEFSPVSDDILKEINWTLLSFRKYSNEINKFLPLKDEFEKLFLLGRYYDAEKTISKIENEICFSLWTLEARFLLNEFSNGGAENKSLLSEFNSGNRSKFYTKSLAHYLSLRAEKSLSVNRFNADLETALYNIIGDSKSKHTDYYLFKLSFLNHLQFTHLKELLAYDFPHSVTDSI